MNYMNNMNMNRYMWNRPGMQQGYNYGKRSADAEPDAYYRPYSYGYSQGYNWPMNSGYNWNMNNMNNNWNMNNMNNNWNMNMNSGYNMNNNWNRYNMNNMNNQWNRNSNSYSYGKRSADAEPMMY